MKREKNNLKRFFCFTLFSIMCFMGINNKSEDLNVYAAENTEELTIPFKGVSTNDGSLVTYKIDAKKKIVTIYISKSRTLGKETPVISFETKEGITIEDTNPYYADYEAMNEIVFISDKDGTKDKWMIKSVSAVNPVLNGQYADPDIDVFNGMYFMYTTTDGFDGWSGTVFHCFSSGNLVDWKDEGIILDVASDDVKWSIGSAWAPTIEEKNGKYYFYFCAKCSTGESQIGVAVADDPRGPFKALDKPLITKDICKEYGVTVGQTIDPSVFTEDDGTSYLVFGNGRAAIVKLNEDMTSLDTTVFQNINGLNDFREALTITKREGKYHFTWSCDDTGSPNYHINYGVSDKLLGDVKNIGTILSKDEENDILGTGHHCILNIPGTDEYYIVYHRFVTPLGKYTEGFGFHRETCIDELKLDEKTGLMKNATPTLEGVWPRTIQQKQKWDSKNVLRFLVTFVIACAVMYFFKRKK